MNAASLAIGYAIGRIGCQVSGDGDYGKATDVPWGMAYPDGVVPTNEVVHPTPIYETLAMGLGAWALWRLRDAFRPGVLFALYLALVGAERFLVEFCAATSPVLGGLTEAQIVSLAAARGEHRVAPAAGALGRAAPRPRARVPLSRRAPRPATAAPRARRRPRERGDRVERDRGERDGPAGRDVELGARGEPEDAGARAEGGGEPDLRCARCAPSRIAAAAGATSSAKTSRLPRLGTAATTAIASSASSASSTRAGRTPSDGAATGSKTATARRRCPAASATPTSAARAPALTRSAVVAPSRSPNSSLSSPTGTSGDSASTAPRPNAVVTTTPTASSGADPRRRATRAR